MLIAGISITVALPQLDNSLGATDNPFVKFAPNVIEAGSLYLETRNLFALRDLIKNRDFEYLSYQGSLTTPMCYETVTWMVATQPVKISSAELAELRKIRNERGDLLVKNFRPLQNNNRRQIFAY